MDRTNTLLAASLVVVVALSWLLAPRAPTRAASGPVFVDHSPVATTRIEIERDTGTLVLERAADGTFALAELFGFPVAPMRVERVLLEPLTGVTRADRAASNSSGFGFESRVAVRLFAGDGRELAAFDQSLGRLAAGGGSFVRASGADVVYRAPALPTLDVTPSVWWDGRLVPGDGRSVVAFAIEFPPDPTAPADGERRRVLFERTTDGAWRVDGAVATAPVAIDRAALELTRLRLVGVAAGEPRPEHRLDAPAIVFEVTTGTPPDSLVTTRIAIGTTDEQLRLFAKSSAHTSNWVVLIDPLAADAVLEPIVQFLGR